MSRTTILYSSAAIHSAVKSLFAKPSARDRRVAIVAYVGRDGASFLPNPEGLRVICSPSPGGTDPDTIRDLMRRGASVEFSDSLHMKVYWSRQRGCVITSANASNNALGVGGLKEAGVLFRAGQVDVDRLVKYAKPRGVTAAELKKLDERTKERNRNLPRERESRDVARLFLAWHALPHRPAWKLGWADDIVYGYARAVNEQTLSMYGLKEPYSWECMEKGKVKPHEWILSFFFTTRGIAQVRWKYVDFVVKVSPKDKLYYRSYPYHMVQVHSPNRYPLPPFSITPGFRKAFGAAVKRFGPDTIRKAKRYAPTTKLLDYIAQEMRKLG